MGTSRLKILVLTIKSWNIHNARKLSSDYIVKIIENPSELTFENVSSFNPNYVFVPHWSWKIPEEIYSNFKCILFHMTNLPYGRGGSPLQNLIVRGHQETKLSAIEVKEELDTGKIYLQESLSLLGTVDEILERASEIIFHEMIPRLIEEEIIPKEQVGKIVKFERRTPSDSKIDSNMKLDEIYDYIRMLDGEGYPNAYIEFGKYCIKFSKANIKNNHIECNVVIELVNKESE